MTANIEKIFEIVSANSGDVTLEVDENGDTCVNWQGLKVYDGGEAFRPAYSPATFWEPEFSDDEEIGTIGNGDSESIATAFIALIEKELAERKSEFEAECEYDAELKWEREHEKEIAAAVEIEWENNWAGREDEFYRLSDEAYDRSRGA